MSRNRLFGLLGHKSSTTAASAETTGQLRKREYLLTIDIFRDLRPEDVSALDHQTEMRTCPKGRLVFSQEDRAEALFLLKKGRVQLYRLTPSGKRLELGTIEPGTFFGEMPLLGESLRHTYAEATSDSLLCVMSRVDVERLIRERPQVALRMMEVLGRRLALGEARLEEMAYRSVPTRIAAVLLRLSEGHDGDEIRITHQELGDMIGALRETVTKILDEFQEAGLVELGRGRIVLRDVDRLCARLEAD
jgi:CRP-like cAMP-binding protein